MVRSPRCWRELKAGLLVLGLLFGATAPSRADDAKRLTAILIVARSKLPDPFFSDSVVLVMNNLAQGPVGLIVNRPTDIPLSSLFPEMKALRGNLYFGGPVEPATVWFLVRAATPPQHAIQACEGVYLSADRDLLFKLLARKEPMDGLKIFLGHAGWAPGQLEAEIGNGDWSSRRADSEGVFKRQREVPWPRPEARPQESI